MDEPPVVDPNENRPDQPINPFEATVVESASDARGTANLPANFWAAVIIAAILFGGLCPFVPGIGVPGLIALIPAVIRVPLVQKRLSIRKPEHVQPSPLIMLLASWVFTLIMGFAAFIAFCIVCFPAGLLLFSAGQEEAMLVYGVFTLCGLIGLAVFLFLFTVSLRLPV